MADPFNKYEIGGAYHWKWYLVNYEGYRDFTNEIVAQFPAPGRVLDAGCGDGLISYLLFRSGFDVFGLDTSEPAIRLAGMVSDMALEESMGADIGAVRGTPLIAGDRDDLLARKAAGALRFEVASVYELNEDEAYDYAVGIEVIEHLRDPERLVETLHRAIRKFAILTTPNGLRPDGTVEDPGPYDHHVWTPDSFAALLDGYDFEFLDLRPGTIAVKLFKGSA